MELIKASLMVAVGGGGSGANIAPKPQQIQRNGTFYARDDNLDGYSEVTVNIDIPTIDETTFSSNGTYTHQGNGGWSPVKVDVWFEVDNLQDATAIADPDKDFEVKPKNTTTDCDIRVYIGIKETPTGTYSDAGKNYTNPNANAWYAVPFVKITNKATGTVVIDREVTPGSTNYNVTTGGYLKVDGWTVNADGSIDVMYSWKNPTFNKPNVICQHITDTSTLRWQSDIVDWSTGPYVVKQEQT